MKIFRNERWGNRRNVVFTEQKNANSIFFTYPTINTVSKNKPKNTCFAYFISHVTKCGVVLMLQYIKEAYRLLALLLQYENSLLNTPDNVCQCLSWINRCHCFYYELRAYQINSVYILNKKRQHVTTERPNGADYDGKRIREL